MEYSILVDGLWTLDEGRSDFPVAHSADESTDPVPSQVIGQSFLVWRVQDGSSTFREGTWILGVLSMKKWTQTGCWLANPANAPRSSLVDASL